MTEQTTVLKSGRLVDHQHARVRSQLRRGEIIIVFDLNTRTTNIILKARSFDCAR